MKNKAFKKLSRPEREEKLRSAIERKTHGLLMPHELNAIAKALPLGQQYTLRCYQRDTDFWHVLSLDRSIRIRPLLSPKTPLDAAAVVTRSVRDLNGSRQLHIYIPLSRAAKGGKTHEQERIPATHGL